jgi:hypothetical protein
LSLDKSANAWKKIADLPDPFLPTTSDPEERIAREAAVRIK